MIPELLEFRLAEIAEDNATVWHSHSAPQFGCVVSGRVRLDLAQIEYQLEPDDFFLIAARHLHRITEFAGTAVYHGFVDYAQQPRYFNRAADAAADLDWLKDKTLVLRGAAGISLELVEVLKLRQHGDARHDLTAQCVLARLFMELQDARPIVLSGEADTRATLCDMRLFQEAVRAMENAYSDARVSVPHVAATCKVSRSTLDKLFRRQVGYGPREFLQRYRIDRAKSLLRLHAIPLSEVATLTGFTDAFCFSRTFKRIAGMPPSRFRKMARQG